MEEARVLRYITEVYGSGFGKVVNRATLLLGLSGCLSGGLFLLVDGWCSFRNLQLPFLADNILLPLTFFGLYLPIGMLQLSRWRFSLKQRRQAALRRIFGSESQACSFAEFMRADYPDAKDLSRWAFPMRAGGFIRLDGGPAFWFAASVLVSLYLQAQTLSVFLVGLVVLIAMLFLPTNIVGLLMSFGRWNPVSAKRLMSYPVAIFLDDVDRSSLGDHSPA
ncbi:hypothetical protein [Acidithiobacillus ferrivorans]|uniref:hypothetical protein n=1 Tax=Acidithiobacillus ferrivorans TaxID=160808 RepID=UPI0012F510EC|nr:hypothetical protein [Acidithiobacillus ferrivorans]